MTVGPRVSEWRKLPMSLKELCIDTTLRCGQAFRWRKIDDEWHCTLQGRVLSLKQDANHLHYRATWPKHAGPGPLSPPPSAVSSPPPAVDEDDTLALLTSYFNLPVSLTALYAHWSRSDPVFARRSPPFTGIRILNQPSWEALVSFICSSNNNISRISQMATKLCLHYGPYVGTVAGEAFHDFPTPQALAGEGVEQKLRELGFGYRARYIAQTARIVSDKGSDWLDSLRHPASPALGRHTLLAESTAEEKVETSYKAAHEALLALPGVGPKVADCVCLMGLGWAEAVPVDTHVWQIATRDYKFGAGKGGMKGGKVAKTFNSAVHDAVGDHFRAIWGEYAGWAQSVLFTSNLKSFAGQAAAGGREGGEKVKTKGRVVKDEAVEEEGFGLEVKEELVEVVKSETMDDGPMERKTRMRVTKRKAVVQNGVNSDACGSTITDIKVTATRTSKRRRRVPG